MPADYEHSTSSRTAIGFVIGPGCRVRRGIGRATPQNDFGGGAFGKLRQRPLSNVARNCPLRVMKNSPHPWLHGLG